MNTQSARDRLRQAGIDPQRLFWLKQVVGLEALDRLPGSAVLVPGDDALVTNAIVDLTTGATVQNTTTVPPGAVYGSLVALEPYLRSQASAAYSGQAGLSGQGTILGGAAGQGGPAASTGEGTGLADVP